MIRKLTLLTAVAMAVGCAAAPAHAQGVHVENSGAHEVESELGFGFYTHVAPGVEVPIIFCDNNWIMDIQEDGEFTLDAEDIGPHPGSTGLCDTMEPCDAHAVWPGSTQEAGLDLFQVHSTFCIEGTGTVLDDAPVHLECAVELGATADSLHCDHPIEGLSPVEFMGELMLHDKLGLMHG